MANVQSPSCLMRMVSGGIIMLACTLASAFFLFVINSIYPFINPILNSLLLNFGIPFAEELVWAFWTVLPCLFGLMAAFVIGWGVNWVIGRISHSRQQPEQA